jgi:hypothetical protein
LSKDPVRPYVKRTEGLIRPPEVSMISLFGGMLGVLPVSMQKKIMASSTEKNPYMGFVVEPYALFLAHEITDIEQAQRLIPAEYKVVPARLFADEAPKPLVIFGGFSVHTSAFWGNRLEMYIIAEHVPTGLLSWLIVDYDSNTLSFDPGQGFAGANTAKAVITTSHRGEVLLDFESAINGRRVAVAASVRDGVETPLDQPLWIEGNLSIGYGGEMSDEPGAPPFGLLFDPGEMERALRIPLDHVQIDAMDWHAGLYDPTPLTCACFPYAQHFITSQVPTSSAVSTREQLDAFVREFNQGPAPQGFSSSAIKKSMFVGWLCSTTLTFSLLGWVIFDWLSNHG